MRAPGSGDRGESLTELLVAVAIMGVAVVVLLGALGTSIRISGIHRGQAVAGADVRAFAEAVEGAINRSPSAYAACAAPATYTAATAFTPHPTYVATITAVRYWNETTFVTTCTTATDTGVQLVSLEVRNGDGSAVERLHVIVRKPCRPVDAACTA